MKKTILIVDDEKEITFLLYRFLSMEGFKVFTATDGESAYRLAKESDPDLIIMDILMPGMDGGDVAERFKKDYALKNIPVIFLTGLISDDESTVYDETTTGRIVMSKSLDIKEQIKTIKKVLDTA